MIETKKHVYAAYDQCRLLGLPICMYLPILKVLQKSGKKSNIKGQRCFSKSLHNKNHNVLQT